MRALKLIAVLVPLLFAVGCAKRTAKKSAPDDTSGTKAQSQLPGAPNAGQNKNASGNTTDEPNWLADPRFKNKEHSTEPTEVGPNGKPPGWVGGTPPGGWTAPVAGVQPSPLGPGGPPPIHTPAPGSTVPNSEPPKPPATSSTTPKYSTVTEADMKEVWVFIENASGASGKMPTPEMTYAALVAASYSAAPLVKDGSITLTRPTTRESIWAYETKALVSGGLVCNQNGVETITAAELRKRLGK